MMIALVYGTAAPAGRLSLAMRAFDAALQAGGGARTVPIDLAAQPLPFAGAVPDATQGANLEAALAAIRGADAVALFMPVYRAAPPGALKNLLDLLPLEALENKPVAQVSMGASPHHYLANTTSLGPVLDWFGAVALPGLYLTSRSFENGQLTEAAAAEIAGHAASLSDATRRLSGLRLLPRPLAAGPGGG